VKEIKVQDLAEKLASGDPVYLLDVRQPWEHEIAALPNSVLIPLPELAARVGEIQTPDEALIVVYCHHGVRSLRGASLLAGVGLKKVVSLAGGIDAWSRTVNATVPRY
jgi:rhodanese-related sulfurtransferase